MPLEGFAELTPHGTVRGWAWNSDAPDDIALLDIFDGGLHYARVVAEHFHEPLKLAGKRSGHCLFEAPVPPAAAPHIHVLFDGTGHRLPMPPAEGFEPHWDWLDGPGLPSRPALLVHRLCQDLLDRPASAMELARFGGRTGTACDLVRLVRDILDEAPNSGLLTSRDAIREAYIGVLNRPADPDGLATFGKALLDGMPLSQVLRILVDSGEFKAALAPAPDPDGELRKLARTLHDAVTTLTLHAVAAPPAGRAADG